VAKVHSGPEPTNQRPQRPFLCARDQFGNACALPFDVPAENVEMAVILKRENS